MRSEEAGAPAELAWVSVDLDAVARNFEKVRKRTAVGVFAVVKADAYGHGAVDVARALSGRAGLCGFVVAREREGMALRRAGIEDEILVLAPGIAAGGAAEETLRRLLGDRLTPQLASLAEVEAIVAAAAGLSPATSVDVHLELDSGMSRAGVAAGELPRALELLGRQPALRLAGVATHLAESEASDASFTAEQLARFRAAVAPLAAERLELTRHVANSAAALDLADTRCEAVRVGGALYGLDLAHRAGEAQPDDRALEPAMSVTARVLQVRTVTAGTPVGYGRRWRALRDTRIALVPVGYADGYPSEVGDRAEVLVGRARRPVVGAVSMDLITVDVGETACAAGDEVVLLGRQGEECLRAEELARAGNEVLYEVTCRFSRRLPRRTRP
jgi:alanine racemase